MPIAVVPIYVIGPAFRDEHTWFDLALPVVMIIAMLVVSRRYSGGRFERQSEALFLRYQHGEISKEELRNAQMPFSWSILWFALFVGAALAAVLLTTVG